MHKAHSPTPPVVSIIVPVYNAAATLGLCIDSILCQRFSDFELLLADDGSGDDSLAICEAYARQDPRVRILRKAHSGVSDTRNQAIAAAKGVYLQFVDCDDWLPPGSTRLLVEAAEAHGCDLVIGDFYRVVGGRIAQKGAIHRRGPFSRADYAEYMMESPADFYYGVLWNKLYRRRLIVDNRLRMDETVNWCEDFLFNLDYLRHAEVFCAVNRPVYYYHKTSGSLTSQAMGVGKVVHMKTMVFHRYNEFYKNSFSEEEYEKMRFSVLRFLFDIAQDGTVAPKPPHPGSLIAQKKAAIRRPPKRMKSRRRPNRRRRGSQ